MRSLTHYGICILISVFITFELSAQSWKVYDESNSGLPDNTVKAIELDQSNKFWFATDGGGLASFNGTNWTIYDQSNAGISSNDLTDLAIDGSGVKWLGAGSQSGLIKFDGSTWQNFKPQNSGIPGNQVNALSIGNSGEVLIGMLVSGYVEYDGNNWDAYNSASSGLPGVPIFDIAVDNAGNRWIATFSGLAQFDGNNWQVYDTAGSGIPSNQVQTIALDNNGNTWVGTLLGGVAKFDGNNWTVFNQSNSGLPSIATTAIAIDDAGNKWFGTQGGGLAKFDGSSWKVYNRSNSQLPGNNINTIAVDTGGAKWLGTDGNGLAVLKGQGTAVQDTIKGTVRFNGDPLAEGQVSLWKRNLLEYNKVDSLKLNNTVNGQFTFEGVKPGDYIVRGAPDTASSIGDQFIPTYHKSTIFWLNAEMITATSNGKTFNADIDLVSPDDAKGPGSISGKIIQAGPGKRKGPGDPQGGIEVLALNDQGNPADFAYSNAEGRYKFDSLPLGQYTVHVEITGFDVNRKNVNLDSQSPRSDSLTFQIDKENDSVYSTNIKPQNKVSAIRSMEVYPIPAQNIVSVNFESKVDQSLIFNLKNNKGQTAKKQDWEVKNGLNQFQLDVSDLEPGFYFLQVYDPVNGMNSIHQKLIIRN